MMPIRRNNQEWLPSIFNDFFDNDWMFRTNTTSPAVNVIENEKDFNIHLTDDSQLVITMEKKNESKNDSSKYLRREFSYSKFQQTLVLPDDVEKDHISASVDNGVLTIDLPKKSQESKAKEHKVIEIK